MLRRDSFAVKIYRGDSKGFAEFTLAYRGQGRRIRRSFIVLKEAQQEAKWMGSAVGGAACWLMPKAPPPISAADSDTIINLTKHQEHRQDNPVYVIDGTVRDHAPVEAFCVRWN